MINTDRQISDFGQRERLITDKNTQPDTLYPKVLQGKRFVIPELKVNEVRVRQRTAIDDPGTRILRRTNEFVLARLKR